LIAMICQQTAIAWSTSCLHRQRCTEHSVHSELQEVFPDISKTHITDCTFCKTEEAEASAAAVAATATAWSTFCIFARIGFSACVEGTKHPAHLDVEVINLRIDRVQAQVEVVPAVK